MNEIKKMILGIFALSILTMFSCKKERNNEDCPYKITAKQVVDPGPKITSHLPPKDNPWGCLVVHINDSMEKMNSNSRIDASVFYEFRDDFLGGKIVPDGYIDRTGYIEYYYVLSEFVIKYRILNAETFGDCFKLLKYGEQVCHTVFEGGESEIVVTPEIYVFCKRQSERIHNDIHFEEVRNVITDLDSDLEYLNGKTKKEFVTYFQ